MTGKNNTRKTETTPETETEQVRAPSPVPSPMDAALSSVLSSLGPRDLSVLAVEHNSMSLSARRIKKEMERDGEVKKELVEFVQFRQGDLISLRYGGTVDGKSLPSGVYLSVQDGDKHVLRQLPYMQREKAIELFRQVGKMQRSFVHVIHATEQVKTALGMES